MNQMITAVMPANKANTLTLDSLLHDLHQGSPQSTGARARFLLARWTPWPVDESKAAGLIGK